MVDDNGIKNAFKNHYIPILYEEVDRDNGSPDPRPNSWSFKLFTIRRDKI